MKVLIVHHSLFMQKRLSEIVSHDSSLTIVGEPGNCNDAIEQMVNLKPDVILTDAPQGDEDCHFLDLALKQYSIPVVLAGRDTRADTSYIIKTLQKGVVDFFTLPNDAATLEEKKDQFAQKIKAAVQAEVKKFKKAEVRRSRFSPSRKKIIVIVSSTGGPQTLEALLTQLPENFPIPLLIVQHMPAHFTRSLAVRLDKASEIEVREAQEGDELQPGLALIAPGDFHMELKAEVQGLEGVISLNQNPSEQGLRPCGNVLLRSVVKIFKENIICVILTGMGHDGTEGSRAVKENGGTVIVEAEQSCIVYGMPKSVVEAGLADGVVTIEKMGVALVQLAGV